MYILMFEDGSNIHVPGDFSSMRLLMSGYRGGNEPPKYACLWFKEKHVTKAIEKSWENKLYNTKLVGVGHVKEENDKIETIIPIPEPFQELHYEEGDLVVQYGDMLYYDEAY